MRTLRLLLASALVAGVLALAAAARAQTELSPEPPRQHHHRHDLEPILPPTFDLETQFAPVKRAAVSLPIAGALAAALAFGIVGAAGLVRYRAKIEDPKDAGVMLSTLAIGLAAGVAQYLLAAFATFVLLAVLWGIESLEPEEQKRFLLKVKTDDSAALRPRIEAVLQQFGVRYELRASSNDAICYELALPWGTRTDRVSNAILRLDRANATAVEWEEKKKKNG